MPVEHSYGDPSKQNILPNPAKRGEPEHIREEKPEPNDPLGQNLIDEPLPPSEQP